MAFKEQNAAEQFIIQFTEVNLSAVRGTAAIEHNVSYNDEETVSPYQPI